MNVSGPSALRLVTVFALLSACATSAPAQSGLPLTIEVERSSRVNRTGGPVRLARRVESASPTILEGVLQIEARDSIGELLSVFHVNDVIVTDGVQYQELMIPGFRSFGGFDVLSLHIKFIDTRNDRSISLDPIELGVPAGSQRALSIAVVRQQAGSTGRDEEQLVDALKLESLHPLGDTSTVQQLLLTRSVRLPGEQLPTDPLRYCAYDLVLLADDALATADEPQLDALLAWVRAGGALCMIIDDARLGRSHARFMNTLAGTDLEDPAFLLDTTGRLVYGAHESPDSPLLFRPGLGRVAVVGWNPSLTRSDAAHWPTTAAFLWRVRNEHFSEIASTGVWDARKTIETVERLGQQGRLMFADFSEGAERYATDMSPKPIQGGIGLVTHLMPRGMKIVPLWLIGGILLLYVVAVVPFAYFVLGGIGLRRWTWVTFPVLTVAFTAFSLVLSNRYMSSADHRGVLVVRDLTTDGRVLRENRLHLLFPSTSRRIETDIGRGLFVPLRFQDFGDENYWMYATGFNYQIEQVRPGPAIVTGRLPIRASAMQAVPQWTPQLNRIMTIPRSLGDEPAFEMPWSQPPDLTLPAVRGALTTLLRERFGHNASAFLFHEYTVTTLLGDGRLFQGDLNSHPYAYTGNQSVAQPANFLHGLCQRNQPGFFGVVSQYAPTGGDRFEDMALLDPTDPREWLLVIVVPTPDETMIYRLLLETRKGRNQ